MTPYNFVLLRAPLQSLNKAFQPIEINPEFEEAIYLATVDLWANIKKNNSGKKVKIDESLLKYWLRSCSRCTPFGLFAGNSIVTMGDATELIIESGINNHTRKVRLDMNFITLMISSIEKDPVLRKQLKFKVNQSLYESPYDLRYVEYMINGSERIYKLTSIEKTEYIITIIEKAKSGATIDELVRELLAIENVSYEDSIAFIDQLCDSQILVSDLELCVTGSEPLEQLIKNIDRYSNIDHLKEIFSNISLSLNSRQNGIEYYEKIIQELRRVTFNDSGFKNVFQVDLFHSLKKNTIKKQIIDKIAHQCSKLLSLTTPKDNSIIEGFKRAFSIKFEDSEIPLTIALDADLGVGYALVTERNSGGSTWVDDLINYSNLSHSEHKIGVLPQFILGKYHDFLEKGLTEIEVTDNDIFTLEKNSNKFSFSNGLYLLGSLQGKLGSFDDDNFQFDLSIIGGPSAGLLLSRFTHGDEILLNYTKQILKNEEQYYPDVVFAEVVHASQIRDTNILLRPILREYEIPYVGKSGLDEDFQIPLSDLLVSVQHDQIILRSVKLNKRIIPRLTTAHNYYMNNSLPIYSFLGDIQNQDISYPKLWDWGIMSNYRYLPRVVFKNIVLKKAQWLMFIEDLKDLPADEEEFISFFKNIRDKYKLPENVIIVEGDNKLLINFSHIKSIKLLVGYVRKFKAIQLQEFLNSDENCILRDENGNPFTTEIIIPVKNEIQVINTYSQRSTSLDNPEKFPPASQWLYYKIYAGVKTQEKILKTYILPFIELCNKEKLFEKFFFVRYTDERPHIRIRFYNSDNSKQQELLKNLSHVIKGLYEKKYSDKVIIDTYLQENNRYQGSLIGHSEDLFNNDSTAILTFISLLDDQDSEFYRIVVGMRSVDMYLNDFNINIFEKYNFFKKMVNIFSQEFSSPSHLRLQVNHKYKKNQKEILRHMDPSKDIQNGIDEAIQLFETRSELNQIPIKAILDKFATNDNNEDLLKLLSSHIHMSINRLFIARQRKYELIIYSFLERFYSSVLAQKKAINA